MPPGKRIDSRAAKTAELNELKHRFVTVSRRYKDQMKHREWLSLNTANKVEKLSTLENTLLHKTQEHEDEVNHMESGRVARVAQMGEDLQTLLDQKHSLEQELASFPLVEHENQRLRALLFELEDQVLDEESDLQGDTEGRRRDAFRDRLVVDTTTRKTLAAMQDSIQEASFKKMKYESQHALRTRRQLEAKLLVRSAEADEMSRKQREKSNELSKMRIYRQVLDEATSLQEKHITSLEKNRQGASRRLAKMQEDLEKTCTMLNQAKEQKAEQSRLSHKLKTMRNEWRNAEMSSLHYRAVTLKSIRSMLYAIRNRMFEEKLSVNQYRAAHEAATTTNGRGRCRSAKATSTTTPQMLLTQIRTHYTDLPHRRAQSAPSAISRLSAGLEALSSQKVESSRGPPLTSYVSSYSSVSNGGTFNTKCRSAKRGAVMGSTLLSPCSLESPAWDFGVVAGVGGGIDYGKNRGPQDWMASDAWSDEETVRIWHSAYGDDQTMVY